MSTYKRFIIVGLSSLYIVSSVLTSYVTAYATAIPVAYTTWEVLEMIFLSFGISFELATSDLAQEAVSEVEDCFELWMNSNGFDDPEQMRADLEACLEVGKDGVITITNDLWNALKGWASSLYQGDIPATELTASDTVALMDVSGFSSSAVNSMYSKINSIYNSGYANALIQVTYQSGSVAYILCYYFVDESPYWSLKLRNGTTGSVQITNGATVNFYQARLYSGSGYETTNVATSVPLGTVYTSQKDSLILSDKYIFCESVDDSIGVVGINVSILCENGCLNDGVDVIFPEEDLSYDICYLPGYDLSATYANGAYDVVTSGRTWDGTDVAGDVVITMPDELTTDIPFQDLYDKVVAGDIPFTDVLDDAGVIPVDTTLDRDLVDGGTIAGAIVDTAIDNAPTIDDTKEETDENGETVQKEVPMTFDLSKLFPFCIPFDIIDFINVLSASPVAPCIEYPIQYPTVNGMETYNLKIDLSKFDKVAELLRKMETLVFIVGLAGITRNHMIRG